MHMFLWLPVEGMHFYTHTHTHNQATFVFLPLYKAQIRKNKTVCNTRFAFGITSQKPKDGFSQSQRKFSEPIPSVCDSALDTKANAAWKRWGWGGGTRKQKHNKNVNVEENARLLQKSNDMGDF